MAELTRKDEIKEIIKPHFGYLKMYMNWDVPLRKIREFHEMTKDAKDIVKKLPKPLISYTDYYEAISDIYLVQKITDVKRAFKDNLNGKSRKFFKEILDNKQMWLLHLDIYEDKQKLEMFFRTSSKPQTLSEYKEYAKSILKFDTTFSRTINRIEGNIQYLTTTSGAYLFKLNPKHLDMVPSNWCIYRNATDIENYIQSMNFYSIWLLVDPNNPIEHNRMVGIDVTREPKSLKFMNSLNQPIDTTKEEAPISNEEFFNIARHKLEYEAFAIDLTDPEIFSLVQTISEKRDEYFEELNKNNPLVHGYQNNPVWEKEKEEEEKNRDDWYDRMLGS